MNVLVMRITKIAFVFLLLLTDASVGATAFVPAKEPESVFLLQHEIDRMLADLDASPWPGRLGIACGHVDFAGKGWAAFDYICPTCGTRTSYPQLICGPHWGDGYDAFLKDLRQTIEFLRSKRLDVRIDERILCSSCRVSLKIPDRGEIVALPEKWPPNRYFLSSYLTTAPRTNFPFRVGDKLRIVSERNIWGWYCYLVIRENASYWIAAKDVSPEGKITAEGTSSWVRYGPDESYPSIGFLNRWCEPDSGVPILETKTNGWIRLNVANDSSYYAYYVPTSYVGRLTSSGAALGRQDFFKRLKWTINGREIDIKPDDCVLLRTFFSGQREIPGRYVNASLKQSRNRSRLGELLTSNPPSVKIPDAEAVLRDLAKPGGWTNGEVTIETDF